MLSDFYTTPFVFGQTSITRGDLESLEKPLNTFSVDDATMYRLAHYTEEATRIRLELNNDQSIDFSDKKQAEIWCEELQKTAAKLHIPNY